MNARPASRTPALTLCALGGVVALLSTTAAASAADKAGVGDGASIAN